MAPDRIPVTGGLAASLLGADPLELGGRAREALAAGVPIFHIDVMDGHFVPNIAFGPEIVASLRRVAGVPFDVHLMIDPFEPFLDPYLEAGADWVTVHLEAGRHHHRYLGKIRERGGRAGLALNPGTPLSAATELLGELDVLLIMTVNPGFGGARFIPSAARKVEQAARLRESLGAHFLISVDGGVDESNIPSLRSAGADVFVAGSSLFRRGDVAERARQLMSAIG